MDEFFVARHIDQTEHVAVFERHVRIAQFDRNAARLFFLETIRVDARQRSHQTRFAVVDMPGRTYDHACTSFNCSINCASSASSSQRKSKRKARSPLRP